MQMQFEYFVVWQISYWLLWPSSVAVVSAVCKYLLHSDRDSKPWHIVCVLTGTQTLICMEGVTL